jgi:hypothetical protein
MFVELYRKGGQEIWTKKIMGMRKRKSSLTSTLTTPQQALTVGWALVKMGTRQEPELEAR